MGAPKSSWPRWRVQKPRKRPEREWRVAAKEWLLTVAGDEGSGGKARPAVSREPSGLSRTPPAAISSLARSKYCITGPWSVKASLSGKPKTLRSP